MTKTHPNASDSIVLFADLQLGIADLPLTTSASALGKAVAGLAKLAQLRNVPVLVSTVSADGKPPVLIPALEGALGEHRRFIRMRADSAQDEAIAEAIRASGKKNILISGVATEIAVSLPAYTFREQGYEVFVVADATGGLTPRTEDAVHKSLVGAGVHLTSVASLAGVFAEKFDDPIAEQAIGVLFSMAGE